jgi:phosphatidylinositol glycan class B
MMSASCNNLPDYDSRIMPLFQWIRHPFFNNYRLLFPAGLLLLFIVTAYFSQGYYHADEQYQIIEFAGLKLGTHQPEDLAWEFKHRLRSAAQPALCYALFSFFSFPGIADPYLLAFLLRAFTGLVAVLCITFFIRKSKSFVPDEDNSSVLWMFVAGLWFIPFLSVRFSSETLSGLMILTASAFLLKAKSNRSALAAGLFFGLAFLFRFQSSVIILFVVFWMWRYHRLRAGQWLLFFSGIATLCLAGVVLDRWFYGSLTFTPLNYLANALDSGGGNFGAEPWYFYIEKLITYTGIPAGMLLLCSLFFLLWKKDFYAALTVVFLLFHSFIPHKEERFIFPVAFLFPYLLARFYVEFPRMVSSVIKEHVLKKGLIIILLSFSLPALVCNSLKPAGIGNIAITDYIHTHYAGKAVRLFHLPWSNPYNPWDGLPIRFYLDGNVQFAKMENLNAWDTLSLAKEEIPLLVVRKTDLKNNEGAQKIAALGFREVKQSVPAWIQSMNRMFYRQLEEQHVLVLYALQNEK